MPSFVLLKQNTTITLIALIFTDPTLKLFFIPNNFSNTFLTLVISESNGGGWNNREIPRQLGSAVLMVSSC